MQEIDRSIEGQKQRAETENLNTQIIFAGRKTNKQIKRQERIWQQDL
jgi:hypothetical protein